MRILTALVVVLSLAFLGWKAWQHVETKRTTDAVVRTVAPLVEYRELYESGSAREANDVLLRTVAALIEADDAGVDLREVLRQSELINNTPTNYSDLLTEALLRNVKIARELALDTPENVADMKEGRSPTVESGPYAGEPAEVDHIVPRSLAPDLDNLLINLELMPRTLNRRKGNKVTERVMQVAHKFHEAGVMMPETYAAVSRLGKEVTH